MIDGSAVRDRAMRYTVTAAITRAAWLGVLWAVLTGRPADSWAYGIPVVVLAVAASLALVPPRPTRVRAAPVLVLMPMLAWVSILGGLDVARRAFAPRPAVNPGTLCYRLRAPRHAVAVLLGYAATVVPGTLVLEVHDDRLLVHVIDRGQPNEATLARMEAWIARAFPDAT